MDIAQLKEIIGLVQSLGVEAKSAFIWYLIVMNANVYIFGAIWSGIAFYVLRSGINFLRNFIYSEKLRDAANVKYDWSKSEIKSACKVLQENVDKIF